MIETGSVAKMLSDVSLKKTIEECVINVVDGIASVYAMDMTSSLFVQASAELAIDDVQLGIGDLELLHKSMVMLKGVPVKVDQVENRLQFSPKTGSKVKFLLTAVDLIPTYDDEFATVGDVIGTELEAYGDGIPLTENIISELLQAMHLFDHNSVVFNVSKKGKVTMHSGNDNEHQIESTIGKIDADAPFTLKVYAKHLAPVLAAIDPNCGPVLSLKEDSSVIIHSTTSSWMLELISEITTQDEE